MVLNLDLLSELTTCTYTRTQTYARTYTVLQNSEGENRQDGNMSNVSVTNAVYSESPLTLFSEGKALKCNNAVQTITKTKENNSSRQTRDTTTKTWIAYGNSLWRASKYEVHKLHQRYILKKDASSGMYTLHIKQNWRHRCVQAYDRTNFYSRPDIVLRSRNWLYI